MSDTTSKRWIKVGATVCTKHNKDILMTVDDVIRETKEIMEPKPSGGATKIQKVFTLGVRCHWVSKDGAYQKGVFHTTELRPYGVDKE